MVEYVPLALVYLPQKQRELFFFFLVNTVFNVAEILVAGHQSSEALKGVLISVSNCLGVCFLVLGFFNPSRRKTAEIIR